MMTIVIPMAGLGTRFSDAGYGEPKWMLQAHGKSMLEWSVDSLPLKEANRLIFVALRAHEEKYGVTRFVEQRYGEKVDVHVHLLDTPTRGQAETVCKVEYLCPAHEGLLVYNIDTAFHSPTLVADLTRPECDGILGAFFSDASNFSFAKLGEDGFVQEVAEKKVISNNALTGCYCFRQASDFFDVFREALNKEELVRGEFYVAPLYNKLIQRGRRICLNFVEEIHVLGTPEEYRQFLLSDPSRLRQE